MSDNSTPRTLNPAFTGLRGLLAIFVVISHTVQHIYFLNSVVLLGTMSVVVFIALSGFLLALPFTQGRTNSWPIWFERRFWRIAPTFYAIYAFSIAVAVYVTHSLDLSQVQALSPEVSMPLVFLNDWFPGATSDGVLWSLPVEVHAYLTFPLLMWAWRRFGVPTATVGYIVAAMFLESRVVGGVHTPMCFYLYAVFALGAFAAWLTQSTEETAVAAVALLTRPPVVAATLVTGAAALCSAGDQMFQITRSEIMAVPICCLTAAVAVGSLSKRIMDLLSGRFLKWTGDRSYSLYLIHIPVLAVLLHPDGLVAPHPWFTTLWQVPVGLAASLAAATVAYWLVEKPSIKRMAKCRPVRPEQ